MSYKKIARKSQTVWFSFAGILLTFCLCSLSGVKVTNARIEKQNIPPPSQKDSPVTSVYRLHKGDHISVRFLYHQELSEPNLVVRPDGLISLQMIEDIRAEGLTTAELKASLEKAYSEILLSPVISISIIEFVAPRVYVNGQVAKPGSYELRAGNSLLQAIALAGGFTPGAHRKLVLHARPIGERQLQVVAVDMTKMLTPGTHAQDIELQDGDYIFVPDSKLSQFSRVVEAFRFAVPGFTVR